MPRVLFCSITCKRIHTQQNTYIVHHNWSNALRATVRHTLGLSPGTIVFELANEKAKNSHVSIVGSKVGSMLLLTHRIVSCLLAQVLFGPFILKNHAEVW